MAHIYCVNFRVTGLLKKLKLSGERLTLIEGAELMQENLNLKKRTENNHLRGNTCNESSDTSLKLGLPFPH
ncbi:hypothetical protein Pint_33423 [Pistacia integerrima]|uniref:Uncharacterized protein n=1 Tax=Pistacia integerrima TaxID=434235 RepID=A0ACC0X975_9ROSI|nr:hypothetical protein Pint_33423 [Pistacia integerrima]